MKLPFLILSNARNGTDTPMAKFHSPLLVLMRMAGTAPAYAISIAGHLLTHIRVCRIFTGPAFSHTTLVRTAAVVRATKEIRRIETADKTEIQSGPVPQIDQLL